jgi:hypothetical protein
MNHAISHLRVSATIGCLVVCALASESHAAEREVWLRGMIGTTSARLQDAGVLGRREFAPGPLFGGGIGISLDRRWLMGLIAASHRRQGSPQDHDFTTASLCFDVERCIPLGGPWSVWAGAELGAIRLHSSATVAASSNLPSVITQHGLLIQPTGSVGYAPSPFLLISGSISYRWTSLDTLRDRGGSQVVVNGENIGVDLTGLVVRLGITLFVL